MKLSAIKFILLFLAQVAVWICAVSTLKDSV